MFIAVRGDIGDQKYGPSDWVKRTVITPKNALLSSLLVVNKGTDCWLQIFDCVGGDEATVYITAGVSGSSVFTLTAHGWTTGQKVAASGTSAALADGNYFARVLSATTVALFTTFEDAMNNTNRLAAAADDDVNLTASSDGEPLELPLVADGAINLTHARFKRGIFVRAVTAADGATLISTADIKVSAEFSNHPLA